MNEDFPKWHNIGLIVIGLFHVITGLILIQQYIDSYMLILVPLWMIIWIQGAITLSIPNQRTKILASIIGGICLIIVGIFFIIVLVTPAPIHPYRIIGMLILGIGLFTTILSLLIRSTSHSD